MRSHPWIIAITFAICLFGAISISAQNSDEPRAVFANRRNGKPKLIALYNLTDGYGCPVARFTGTIVHVKYDEELALRVLGITLVTRKGDREYINVDQSLYEEFKLPRAELGWVHTLLAKGRKVRITAFMCGVSGGVMFLHHVRALN
ncbi:MAG: hypothetical protein D6735_13090 [Acidobacteria bacterium]|nr:MAG: hypothetical protein D6735_13090 [Acidobacteriota bacterium]